MKTVFNGKYVVIGCENGNLMFIKVENDIRVAKYVSGEKLSFVDESLYDISGDIRDIYEDPFAS